MNHKECTPANRTATCVEPPPLWIAHEVRERLIRDRVDPEISDYRKVVKILNKDGVSKADLTGLWAVIRQEDYRKLVSMEEYTRSTQLRKVNLLKLFEGWLRR